MTTKKELREYVYNQIANRRKAVRTELRVQVRRLVDIVLARHFSGGKELAKKAGETAEAITAYYQKHDEYIGGMSWNLTSAVKELNNLDPYKDVAKTQTNDIYDYLLGDGIRKGKGEFCYVERELREAGKAARERLRKLDVLESELAAIITSSKSGPKAGEKLIELGVDLSGLTIVVAPMLPAIVKLSVDPNIMKG
jgi:hypothetical protein